MDKKNIRIKKMIPGTLVLRFQNALEYSQERDFVIRHGRDHIVLGIDLVVSMFQINGTMDLYRKGYFTFSEEDREAVFNRARELDLYYGDDSGDAAQYRQPSIMYSEKEIEEAIRFKRLSVIREIVEDGSKAQHTLLIEVARKNVGNLSLDIAKIIENKLGIDLSEMGDE